MHRELENQVAVITGAAQGLGLAIAKRLASDGARIAMLDLQPGLLDAAAKEVGDLAQSFAVDVTREEEVDRIIAQVAEAFGRIDILVNGAGVTTWAPIVELDESEWDRVVDINLKSAFLCSRAVAPHMIAQRSGKIVNIASGLGHSPSVEVGHYAAAKAGVIALSKTLALELAPHKINVNSVAPGIIDTPFVAPRRTREELLAIGERIPLGRVGQPDDVARVVVFLVSSASEYMTGQTLFINGGALMP